MEKESALWHKVSEEEKTGILEQAKAIMNSFHGALSSVEKEEKIKEAGVERDECERQEIGGEEMKESEPDFRKIMLKNAPKTKEDCIEVEKGAWIE